jgi:lysosomal alpha-glucosidase
LVSNYFYGIGEHRDNLAHKTSWSSFTLWNRDTSPSTNTNLYGAHPFYITIEPDGNALGFFLVNSNGMDVDVSPLPALTFTTIGGIIDFYIYLGPTPQDVVMQHTDVVGRSMFPPYFSLGFHLCRWRYDNSTNLKNVIYRNRAAGIPYDTQWTDIDAMNLRMDWTYDKENFAELPQIVDDLHAHGQHYVNIIDPAISNTAGYYPYENGVENNVFIRHSDNNEFLVGKVWPGSTVFPDFTNPNTTKWWTDLAMKFHDQVKYDGIWIDMNEPSNFVDGSDRGCTNSKYDKPPYTPRVMDRDLDSKTICPSSIQFLSNHYNLHNMYGHFEAIATFNALRTIESTKRPFVLTRSSFAGTGRYSAHWSGDNRALWDDLYYSIPNMLNFNMFGVSMVGSDICGFMGDTTEELCIRWMQLGSFYPFMRNHNDDRSKDQDPAAFSLEAQAIMKKALKMRYTLLPYLYTLFYRSVVYGETVVRPLFFEFTHDKLTHGIDQQFMFGQAFLITPVLEQGATSVQGYFPNETWYQYQNGEQLNNTQGPYVTLNAPLSEINVHVRAGYVIPYQHPSVTTTASRKNPFGLLVTLKPGLSSNGTLFWDDGESYDSIDNKKFNLFNFTANEGFLQVDRVVFGYDVQMILNEVKVYGVEKQPQAVQINNQEYDNFIYDDIHKTLNIQYFYIDLREFDSISITWN